MSIILFKNGRLVNRGKVVEADVAVSHGRIERVDSAISPTRETTVIDLNGKYLLPGIIDDQVHFREPGLTHKGRIFTESRAAVAGGVTSFMEMPNTQPQTLTQALLEAKYAIGAKDSPANYSFFMGASNDNLEEVLRTNPEAVCGVKIFMGSSTGSMLVDNPTTLEKLFATVPMLMATHCEDEGTIRQNLDLWKQQFGEDIPMDQHPLIRSREACILSSSMAIELARKHDTRLHILHISTREEAAMFENTLPLKEKRITAEACVHHLHFTDKDYGTLGSLIKCNPAIKTETDREAIWQAVMDDRIDIIATDHAPHTWEEKQGKYLQSPSGLPLVQHTLNLMLEEVQAGRLTIEKVVEKMCHAPADCFRVKDRGYLDEGMWADMVILDVDAEWQVEKDQLFYHCGWSPLEGKRFKGKILQTWVNGHLAYDNGNIVAQQSGMRLQFDHKD